MIKRINNKKVCIIRTVGTFYSSVIKHVHLLRHDLGIAFKKFCVKIFFYTLFSNVSKNIDHYFLALLN